MTLNEKSNRLPPTQQPAFTAYLPGLLLAVLLAGAAYGLGHLLPVVGGPVFGITMGIILATVWQIPTVFSRGLKFTSKYILQLSVILLGFEMNLASVLQVGESSLLLILLTLSAAFITALLAGRALKLGGKLTALIGVGTAICGGSAIAAASSAIDADEREVSFSISTIFLFNVLAVFLFPLIGHLLRLSDAGFGLWAGTAINDTSSVVAAAYSYSPAAGQFATIVKLTRSLMILPITLIMALAYARKQGGQSQFKLWRVFPWFVIGFLLASLVRTFGLLPVSVDLALANGGRFLIIAAMVAIGLATSLQAFRRSGPRALLLGGVTWLVVMVTSLAVQYTSNSLF